MSDVVNLRRARKRKAREQSETDAASRRVAFGISKAEKQAARTRRELAERGLDAHRLVATRVHARDED